jgi:FAD/FMN-containing dehydrogenase
VKLCLAHNVSIVPQGGLTGLVAGGITHADQLTISLTRMNRMPEIDKVSGLAYVDAGVTVAALQQASAHYGLEPGIDLASRDSATLGGMASTNAGGMSAFRYGVMRHRILGVEAVLPNGEIYSDMVAVVKNAAGYDLKHLLIGAEGTLGIITRLVIKLEPLPTKTLTTLFSLPDTKTALSLVAQARREHRVVAAEAIWRSFFRFTSDALNWRTADYDVSAPIHLLLKLSGGPRSDLVEEMASLYTGALKEHGPVTSVMAGSLAQERSLWSLREDTGLIYRHYPDAPSYDVSVPARHIDAYLARALPDLRALEDGLEPFVFGHLADGNLHIVLNLPGSWLSEERRLVVEDILYRDLAGYGGSFSAEHGIGSKRLRALAERSPEGKLALMRRVKYTLDPGNFFNPGVVIEIESRQSERGSKHG